MNDIEKVRNIIAREQSRREEFYEGARYALKLLEAAEFAEKEIRQEDKETTKPTNYDRIRNMSMEEMAEFINTNCCAHCVTEDAYCCMGENFCHNGIIAWLKQEAEENHE